MSARGADGAEPDGGGQILFWRGALYATVLYAVLFGVLGAALWRAL